MYLPFFLVVLSIYLVLSILGNSPGISVVLSNYYWYFFDIPGILYGIVRSEGRGVPWCSTGTSKEFTDRKSGIMVIRGQ